MCLGVFHLGFILFGTLWVSWSMRAARGSASLLSSHGRAPTHPPDQCLSAACTAGRIHSPPEGVHTPRAGVHTPPGGVHTQASTATEGCVARGDCGLWGIDCPPYEEWCSLPGLYGPVGSFRPSGAFIAPSLDPAPVPCPSSSQTVLILTRHLL